MAKSVPIEVKNILEKISIDHLQALVNISNDEKNIPNFIGILELLARMDQGVILKGAGGVNSMDTMIDSSIKNAFNRGRIAGFTLVHSLIKHAPRFMDKRLEKKSGKHTG